MKARWEDHACPVVVRVRPFCPNKLGRGEAMRYLPFPKPLVGWMLGCPSCGFIELHDHDRLGFTEDLEGTLRACSKAIVCSCCRRTISIAGGVVMATMLGPKQKLTITDGVLSKA